MSGPEEWATTTHVWAAEVDRAHLEQVRAQLGVGAAAGGRRHLILEVLAYADDEAAALGRTGRVRVERRADGSVCVDDDGRGTDTRRDDRGRVIRKPVMATQGVRFADEGSAPPLPDGLPRRGLSTVAALSRVLVHENHRAEGAWSQTYRSGVPDAALASVAPRGYTGTRVEFWADVAGPSEVTAADLSAYEHLVTLLA